MNANFFLLIVTKVRRLFKLAKIYSFGNKICNFQQYILKEIELKVSCSNIWMHEKSKLKGPRKTAECMCKSRKGCVEGGSKKTSTCKDLVLSLHTSVIKITCIVFMCSVFMGMVYM